MHSHPEVKVRCPVQPRPSFFPRCQKRLFSRPCVLKDVNEGRGEEKDGRGGAPRAVDPRDEGGGVAPHSSPPAVGSNTLPQRTTRNTIYPKGRRLCYLLGLPKKKRIPPIHFGGAAVPFTPQFLASTHALVVLRGLRIPGCRAQGSGFRVQGSRDKGLERGGKIQLPFLPPFAGGIRSLGGPPILTCSISLADIGVARCHSWRVRCDARSKERGFAARGTRAATDSRRLRRT